jgi:arylsulfatase A-like enzyme
MCRQTAVLGVLVVAMLAGGCAEPPPPNVVMIVVDTLRADHLGCYGYARDTSPNIDRFAAGAVRYAHAYAAAPWTTPSVAALLTSRYPSELGIVAEPNRLDDRFVLLSEVLAAEGYATGAVVSHFFLGSEWNFAQGYHSFDETNVLGHTGISSPGTTESALAMLRAGKGLQPFFLFAHYFDPHYDYIEHPGHRFSDPGYRGPIRSGARYEELIAQIESLTDADRTQLVDLYDSEISFTDAHIGRLLAALDELGLADDTIVVLTADHGEELLDRGGIGHGQSLYQEQIAVPLIIRYPGGRPAVVEQSVGLIDVYPTLLSFLGIAISHPISGRSFLGIERPGPAARPVFSESEWGSVRAAVSGPLKLLHHLPGGFESLFDLRADPGETRDLLPQIAAGGNPALGEALFAADRSAPTARNVADLQRQLAAWMRVMERSRHAGPQVELSDEDRAQLRALGYLRPR